MVLVTNVLGKLVNRNDKIGKRISQESWVIETLILKRMPRNGLGD
jgi:hypothetical protein